MITITPIFVLIALLALALIVFLAKGHFSSDADWQKLTDRLRPVDVGAFCNLIAASEQEFLREHLPQGEFKTIHRQRMLAAIGYVRGAAHNAAILTRLGQAARQHSDPAIRQAGEGLVDNGLRLRIYAFRLLPKLCLSMVFPRVVPTADLVTEAYDTICRHVVRLNRLHFPTHGMSSAL